MGAKRNNAGKIRLSLVPKALIEETAKVLMFGGAKYGENNWKKGGDKLTAHLLMDSCLRHVQDYLEGEDLDKESGLHNLAHASCNIAFLLHHLEKGTLIDDRYLAQKKHKD